MAASSDFFLGSALEMRPGNADRSPLGTSEGITEDKPLGLQDGGADRDKLGNELGIPDDTSFWSQTQPCRWEQLEKRLGIEGGFKLCNEHG